MKAGGVYAADGIARGNLAGGDVGAAVDRELQRDRQLCKVDVVDDQYGQPTWTGDLSAQIVRLVQSDAPPGIYNGTNAGRTSWRGLAQEGFTLLGLDPDRVRPTTSDKFPRPAPRPSNSVLGHDRWAKAGLPPMRHWRDALHAAWPELAPNR